MTTSFVKITIPDRNNTNCDIANVLSSSYLEDIKSLLLQCFGNTEIITPSTLYMCINDKKQILALACMTLNSTESLRHYNAQYIYKVCVNPLFRKQGYGTMIMKHILVDKSYILYVDPDNKSAYKLYSKLGFQKILTERWENIDWHVLYLKL